MHVYENSAEEVVNQSATAGEHKIISGFETPPSKTHIFCSGQIRHSQIFASNAPQKKDSNNHCKQHHASLFHYSDSVVCIQLKAPLHSPIIAASLALNPLVLCSKLSVVVLLHKV